MSGCKIEFIREPLNLMGLFFSDEEKKLIGLEIKKMLQKRAIRHASFNPRQFALICLLFQRRVAKACYQFKTP